MSTQPWEFAHTMAQVARGAQHTPDVQIEHVEGGVYKLSIDKEALHLTAQDLLDVMDWALQNSRTLLSQATDETPATWQPRKSPRD